MMRSCTATSHVRQFKPAGVVSQPARCARLSFRLVCTGAARTGSAPPQTPAVVVGAGIGGLATAVALRKIGYPVVVLERSAGLRAEGAAIALWTNAFAALRSLDAAEPIQAQHPQLCKLQLCASDGRVLKSFHFDEIRDFTHELRGLRRATLTDTLAALLPEGTVRFGSAITQVGVDAQSGQPTVQLASGESVRASLLVGADGARSSVAAHLQLPPAQYAGYVAYRGMAQFPSSGLPVPDQTTRQIYGRGVRAGMYPVSDREVYWFVCFNAPAEAPVPGSKADGKREALEVVAGWGGGVSECIQATSEEDISRSRIADRWLPGRGKGLITLVGDALHPMTPNLGQGGGAALEDAVVLARCIKNAGGSGATHAQLEQALRSYEQERLRRCLKLTVRSNLMGAALQLEWAPVIAVREFVMSKLPSPRSFLNHAEFNPGTL